MAVRDNQRTREDPTRKKKKLTRNRSAADKLDQRGALSGVSGLANCSGGVHFDFYVVGGFENVVIINSVVIVLNSNYCSAEEFFSFFSLVVKWLD